jgi:hypothetical protein
MGSGHHCDGPNRRRPRPWWLSPSLCSGPVSSGGMAALAQGRCCLQPGVDVGCPLVDPAARSERSRRFKSRVLAGGAGERIRGFGATQAPSPASNSAGSPPTQPCSLVLRGRHGCAAQLPGRHRRRPGRRRCDPNGRGPVVIRSRVLGPQQYPASDQVGFGQVRDQHLQAGADDVLHLPRVPVTRIGVTSTVCSGRPRKNFTSSSQTHPCSRPLDADFPGALVNRVDRDRGAHRRNDACRRQGSGSLFGLVLAQR